MEIRQVTGFFTILLVLLITLQNVNSQVPFGLPHHIFKNIEPHLPVLREKWLTLQGKTGGNQFEDNKTEEMIKEYFPTSNLLNHHLVLERFLNQILENVTWPCSNQVRNVISEATSGGPASSRKKRALQMMDANGQLTPHIFTGDRSAPGDFHGCIQINAEEDDSTQTGKINGKYCTSYLIPKPSLWIDLGYIANPMSPANQLSNDPEKAFDLVIERIRSFGSSSVLPMMGSCFPASCSKKDVEIILNSLHSNLPSNSLGQVVMACYTAEKPWDIPAYICLTILSTIVSLSIAGTLLDVHRSSSGKTCTTPSFGIQILLAFSFFTNTRKLFATPLQTDQLNCLNGLKFLSTAWILLGHTLIGILYQNTSNLSLAQIHKDWTLAPVLNTANAVDTFFTISGTLVAFHLLKELDKSHGKLRYPLYVIHRLIRLVPVYLIILGIVATLTPYVGNGPLWFGVEKDSEACRRYWWHNILFINNLMHYEDTSMCHMVSWYLANDFQFYLLAPLVVYPLWRKNQVGLGLIGILSVVSVIVPGVIKTRNNLPPIQTIKENLGYMEDIYMKPWCRFGPFIVGIFLGYLLHCKSKSKKLFTNIPKFVVQVGWLTCTLSAFALIMGDMFYMDPENEDAAFSNSLHSVLFCGLNRLLWSICVAWTVFACATGNGGLLDLILSHKVFVPLSRLTFSMFFSAYQIQLIYHLMQPREFYFSKYALVNVFFAHMVVCIFAAYVQLMLFESPLIQLEKMVFGRQTKKQKTVDKTSYKDE